jgi:hypothetical protein
MVCGSPTGRSDGKKRQSLAALHTGAPQSPPPPPALRALCALRGPRLPGLCVSLRPPRGPSDRASRSCIGTSVAGALRPRLPTGAPRWAGTSQSLAEQELRATAVASRVQRLGKPRSILNSASNLRFTYFLHYYNIYCILIFDGLPQNAFDPAPRLGGPGA